MVGFWLIFLFDSFYYKAHRRHGIGNSRAEDTHAREIGRHADPFTRCQPSPVIGGHPSPLDCHPSPSSPGHPEHNHYSSSSSSWSRASCNTLHSSIIASNSSPCYRQDAHRTRTTGDQQLGRHSPPLEGAIKPFHLVVPTPRPAATIIS